jgi:GH15 family glucan-1,4-alpha-glucosidase
VAKFPPIADYAFLSNCEAEALVAPDGSVEWLCLPRPDMPSVFGALLDRSAGFFRFAPSNTRVPSQRRYLPGTNVLETSWHTPMGWCVVRDALIVGPSDGTERRQGWKRAPGDTSARDIFLRVAQCHSGRVDIEVDVLPLFEYGATEAYWEYEGEGYGHAKVTAGDVTLGMESGMQLNVSGARVRGRTMLEQGQSTWVALSWGPHTCEDLNSAFEHMQNTEHFWRTWLSEAHIPDHRFRPLIERSALALKGLSYAPTGAILAAATTSLPETPGGERNWDYRYTWIRDSAFMLRALHRLGFDWEAIEYFAFVLDAIRQPTKEGESALQIMYGIDGRRDLTESTIDHLSGYMESRPVRIGNGAYNQQQHDVWGMLLDSVQSHIHAGGQIGPNTWQGLAYLVDLAIDAYNEPDQGIWEMRGPPQHFVASKVMCWVAVDRGIKLAIDRDDHDRATRWQKAADEMKDEICQKGVDERGVFVQHYGGKELDASVLLLPIMGFLPPDDERIRATVLAIANELTQDGLVLRYRLDAADDGLSNDAEGTFTICSFWLVAALAMIGELEQAQALFEKLISFAGPLQLYAEEIDATTGLHLGNFPQAFTHLALIDAANRLIESEATEE